MSGLIAFRMDSSDLHGGGLASILFLRNGRVPVKGTPMLK